MGVGGVGTNFVPVYQSKVFLSEKGHSVSTDSYWFHNPDCDLDYGILDHSIVPLEYLFHPAFLTRKQLKPISVTLRAPVEVPHVEPCGLVALSLSVGSSSFFAPKTACNFGGFEK